MSTNYDIIEVSAGDTFSKTISDGETWENKLIDITANGASYDINASANNFTIRNIGFVGHIDDSSGNQDPFRVRVPDSSSSATVENVCFEVTCESTERDSNQHHGATGVYHWRDHAGHVDYDGIYLQNFADNGIYASSPGHDAADAKGGTVSISNSYAVNCNTSCFRLGTSGSSVNNCVAANGGHRGVWAYYEHPEVSDTDIVDCGSDIALGDSNYEKSDNAQVTMTNSRWVTETAHGGASTSNIHGSSVGDPIHRDPSDLGCPSTAEEAASGSTGDGSSPPNEPDQPDNVIASGSVEHTELDGGGWGFSVWSENGSTVTDWRIDALRDQDGSHLDDDEEVYEIIEVASGETLRVEVGDGETIENILYDVSADGAAVEIETTGSDWDIQKVAVEGQLSNDRPVIRCSEPDPNTASTINTVYLGDGSRGGYRVNAIGIKGDHEGIVDIGNVYVDDVGPSAIDATDFGAQGFVQIDQCYSRDAGHSHYRVSRGRIASSVAANDTDTGVGVWGYAPGRVEVEATHLTVGGDAYSVRAGADNKQTHVDVANVQLNTDHDGGYTTTNGSTIEWYGENGTRPEDYVPEDCPETAHEAASNTASLAPAPDPEPFPEYDGPVPAPAIYVSDDTAQGDTTIERVNVQNNTGPGIYAVNEKTESGLIEVRDSFLANNGDANLVIGTPHSTTHDEVIVGGNETSESVTLDAGETHEGTLLWTPDDAGDYDVAVESNDDSETTAVTVAEGDGTAITLGDNEVISNVVYDVTADGAAIDITLAGDGAGLRNVAVVGEQSSPVVTANVPSGGVADIERCYFDSGGGTGVSLANTHSGRVRVANSTLRNFTTAVDAQADVGPVTIDTCWLVNNSDHVLVGADGSNVWDTVFVHNGDGVGVETYNYGSHGDIVVDNCDFTWMGDGKAATTGDGTGYATVYNCRFEGDEPTEDDVINGNNDGGDPNDTAPDDFDVITVGPDETYEHTVGSTDVWENKLIDVTATGAEYDIVADGTDWEIRQIGIDGSVDDSTFTVSEINSGVESIVEYIYLPDGETIDVSDDSDGTVTIQQVNVNDDADAPDSPENAAAGADPGSGGWGEIDFGDPAQEPPTSVPQSVEQATKATTVANTHIKEESTATGIRAAHGDVHVYDSEIEGDPTRESVDGGRIHSVNSQWGDEANPALAEAIPADSVEATHQTISDSSDPE